ncbi:MAG: DNA ligase D [Thermoanaerobaculia bacterium]
MRKGRALADYEAKRDFENTPEPDSGGRSKVPASPAGAHGLFVVQKHAARNLHYDFRLEHEGVLLSWAVPKGPSLDPGTKRLAVQVEDHPLGYATFEGRIPAGSYGAGTVAIWDRGHWAPHGDVDQGLAGGRLDFRLLSGKLAGEWHLVRLAKDTASASRGKPNWLLFRGKDTGAPPAGGAAPRAAAGRRASPPGHRPSGPPSEAAAALFSLATLVSQPPAGNDWLHETKWDGYRLLAARQGDAVSLWSRSGADWSDRLPEITMALSELGGESALLDGELIVTEDGRSRFQALQAALGEAPGTVARRGLSFIAFDLLTLDGEDLRTLPLIERKRRLKLLLATLPARSRVRPSPHQVGRGDERLASAREKGLEGIVSKRTDAPYRSGRGRDWLKIKCHQRQELVIAGYTLARTTMARAGELGELGALLLAVREARGGFTYAGRVGTGFDRSTRRDLLRRLRKLESDRPSISGPLPDTAAVHWVRPALVAEVRFSEWTADGRLRHPSFVGLREDKVAAEVRREVPERGAQTTRGAATVSRARPGRGDVQVEGVPISHPERLLFADSKLAKVDLARYFAAVWPHLEPHLRDRPLAFLRCPGGAREPCFFQKHWTAKTPGVEPVEVSEPGESSTAHAQIDSVAGLVGLAQAGVVELHLWGARAPRLEYPDRLVFDLDPGPGVVWKQVVAGARLVRALLEELGLQSFALLSGGKGVHVVVPLLPRRRWPEVKAFAAGIAHALALASPERYVDRAAKGARDRRIYVDYLRNARGATAIAPYSPRARARGTVAAPIAWAELARAAPGRWTIETLPRRLRSRARDPWAQYFAVQQELTSAALAKVGIIETGERPKRTAKISKKRTRARGG